MVNLFNYIDRQSPVHKLTGAAKFALLILWMLAAMTTFCTPYLCALTVLAVLLFRLSKIRFRDVAVMIWLTLVFLALNNILIYLFSPEHGVEIYGSRTLLFAGIGRYTVTAQQLLYHLNVVLKYTATIPIVLLFVATTNPSEFAASLNRLGVSYKISYSVALALRYIPDTVREFHDISQSQQARGIEMSRKENMVKRLTNAAAIILPLILSGMDRIDVVTNAMELRGFGKNKTRTWYMGRKFSTGDILCILLGILLVAVSLSYTLWNGGRYWNPFG